MGYGFLSAVDVDVHSSLFLIAYQSVMSSRLLLQNEYPTGFSRPADFMCAACVDSNRGKAEGDNRIVVAVVGFVFAVALAHVVADDVAGVL